MSYLTNYKKRNIMVFTLLKDDMEMIENFEEIEDLKARTYQSTVDELKLFTVKTANVAAIVSRGELFSIIYLSKKSDLAKYNIISITEPFQKKHNSTIEVECNNLLQLEFTDIRRKQSPEFLEEHKHSLLPITDLQIKTIRDFIMANRNKPFIINCDAGISRSPAIGMLVENLIGTDDDINKIQNFNRYSVNQLMLSKFGI